jgi:hypothetical protein
VKIDKGPKEVFISEIQKVFIPTKAKNLNTLFLIPLLNFRNCLFWKIKRYNNDCSVIFYDFTYNLQAGFSLSFQGSVNFKFGVLFAKQGQTTDDEILSNGRSICQLPSQQIFKRFVHLLHLLFHLEKESDTFDNFLKLLGDRILLKGWTKFRGGLDAKCTYIISMHSF